MTIHPARLANARHIQGYTHALTDRGRTLTHQESLQLLGALDDLLTDYTNTHRGN